MLPVIKSYLRALLATTLTAMLAIGKIPTEFSNTDWLTVASAVWVAFIPVIIRALDPKDTAFGINKK